MASELAEEGFKEFNDFRLEKLILINRHWYFNSMGKLCENKNDSSGAASYFLKSSEVTKKLGWGNTSRDELKSYKKNLARASDDDKKLHIHIDEAIGLSDGPKDESYLEGIRCQEMAEREENLERKLEYFKDAMTHYQKCGADGRVQVVNYKIKCTETGIAENDLKDLPSSVPSPLDDEELNEILSMGEGQKVEFKPNIRYSMNDKKPNSSLAKGCMIKIVAFMNSDGGTLLIGVKDNSDVIGIEHECMKYGYKGRDGFDLELTGLINRYIGAKFYDEYIKVSYPQKNKKTVCMIKIKKSDEKVCFIDGNNNEYWVRLSGSTKRID